MKYDVEVDNYCGNKQAAGEGGGESQEKCNKDRDKRNEGNYHGNMKCRQKWGNWFTQSGMAE